MEEQEDDYGLDPMVSLGFILGVPLSKVEDIHRALDAVDGVKLIVSRVGAPRTLWLVRQDGEPPREGAGR